jgi:hypothetical protein
MSTYTDYFSLKKPSRGENCLIADFNGNIDSVDLIMHQNRQMSADVYDPQRQEPYMKGECAIYENVLYECLEDNVTGTWDATKWEVTTLAKQVFKALCNVVANPAGSASSTLTKLGIGGVNYEIQGSGGGGGGGGDYTEETLWSGSVEASTSGELITLSEPITNFDAIYMVVGSGTSWYIPAWYITSQLTVGEHYVGSVNDNIAANWYLTSLSSLTVTSISSSNKTTYTKIVGIKFGSGGGSHIYSTTERVVGKWVDNSDVYERTILFTLASSSAYTSVTLASIADIDNVWVQTAFAINTSSGVKYTSPLGAYIANPTETDFGGFLTYNNGNLNLEYRCGQFLWNGTANVVIRYTKSTV